MQPSSTPDRCQRLISTASREVIDCLRLNGLRVGLEEVGQSIEVHLTQCDGTDLPTVRFDQADEREAMVAPCHHPLLERSVGSNVILRRPAAGEHQSLIRKLT